MRINRYIAQATGLSRRAADSAIQAGRVMVNSQPVPAGYEVKNDDVVTLDGRVITTPVKTITILLNKPAGYVCSRAGQGSKTIYDLLPTELHHLKPVGRLDKDSSVLLLMTNDGQLANKLTHPRYRKEKIYQVSLDKSLRPEDKQAIEKGIKIEDGISKLHLQKLTNSNFLVSMTEGRNRQIRRTFAALGYKVTKLHRIRFGNYELGEINTAEYKII